MYLASGERAWGGEGGGGGWEISITDKVSCGLIFDNAKIFICRRSENKTLGGFWEFPGGKVESNESDEECLKRELLEELEMDVDIVKHFKTVHHDYETFSIELISFLCEYKSSAFSMNDHDEYRWVMTKDLPELELTPADIPIAKALITEGY